MRNDREAHMALSEQAKQDEAFRQEALEKLRPRAKVQAQLYRAPARKPKTRFQRVVAFLRGKR